VIKAGIDLSEESIQRAVEALDEDRVDEALNILEPLVESDYDDPDALVYLGIAYVQAEMPEKAVDVLERADNLIEEHFVVSLFLGRALRILKRFDEAEDHLRTAIRLDPNESEAWLDLGKCLYNRGDYGSAVQVWEDAKSKFPNDLGIRGMYALGLYRLGDYSAAADEWAAIHRLEPSLMAAISNYAYLLLIQDRIFEAAPFVGRAHQIDSDDYRSQILLGELRLLAGEHEGALDCFTKVIRQDPHNVEALARLALLSGMIKDEETLRHYLDRAEAEAGKTPESWRGLCYVYEKLGWEEEFRNCLIRWTQEDSGAAAAWLALAIEYDRIGGLEQSRNAWRTVFELRQYVKIHCPECENDERIPYSSEIGFDVYENRFCISCGALILMPAGLAKM
jgi:tetratricopeptide (TPR) repeat protein